MNIKPLKSFFIRYFALGAFLIVAVLSRPYYYADSYEYAHTIMDQEAGKPAPLFLESSHAIWRPIGLAAHQAFKWPISKFLDFYMDGRPSVFAEVSAALILVVFVLTIVGIFYLYRLLRLFPLSETTVHATALLYVISQCIVNYSRTGTSYMAGLSVIIIGLFYTIRNHEHTKFKDFLLGGILLAIAPLLWLPFVLALPAAIFARPLIYGWKRNTIKGSAILICISLATSVFIFILIVAHLNIGSLAGASKWFFRPGQSGPNAGPQRTFFGLSKTLFYLGDQGLYVKRFLLHDPYNPVSALSLIGLGIWKQALFYCLLAASIVTIWRSPATRKYLLFLFVGFIPTIALSILWDGSALERHMPLLPFMFVGFALMLEKGSKPVKSLFIVVSIATVLVNLGGMWRANLREDEIKVDEKIEEMWPRLNDHSLVAITSAHDDLGKFQWNNPFDKFNQSSRLQPYALISMGYDSARLWREKFESASVSSWSKGGNVWVSRSLLALAPAKDMYWIEGSDPVSWSQISGYFQSHRYSDSTKDFLLLQPGSLVLAPPEVSVLKPE